MATQKRVIVFDFDGVVADSFALHLACWREVMGERGASLDDDAVRKAIGWSAFDTARVLAKKVGVHAKPEEIAKQKSALFEQRAASALQPMTGAVDAITRLGSNNEVAVTSSQPKQVVQSALKRFGVADHLGTVVTADDLGSDHELDELLTIVLKHFKLPPPAGAMVDDSRNGLLAAERAGMKSVAFDSNPTFKIDFSMADAVVGSLDELQPELLDAVFS